MTRTDNSTPKQAVERTKTTPLASAAGSARDGSWMDEWGACKVCDGEIPHGHSNNCDLYKLECEIDRLRTAIKETLTEQAHLADGDVCTLIKLKRAITPNEKALPPRGNDGGAH